MVGLGKSALSRAVGKRLGWPVVDKDDYSDVLMDQVEAHGPLAYACMFSAAESLLTQGFSVICDSPLRGRVGYERAVGVSGQSGAELRVVTCTISDESVWRERIETRERRPAHVIQTWSDLQRYRRQAEGDFDYAVSCPRLELDMAAPLEGLTERVAVWLQDPRTSETDAAFKGSRGP